MFRPGDPWHCYGMGICSSKLKLRPGKPRTWRPALLLVVSALVLGSCQYRNKSGEVVVSRTDTAVAMGWLTGNIVKNTVTAPFKDNSRPFRIRTPFFSPDSKFLVMDYLHADKKAVLAVWDIENERLQKLPEAPKGRAWITPSFSPNGQQVLFADCEVKGPDCHVAVIDRDGSHFQRLTSSSNPNYPSIE